MMVPDVRGPVPDDQIIQLLLGVYVLVVIMVWRAFSAFNRWWPDFVSTVMGIVSSGGMVLFLFIYVLIMM